MSLFVFIVFYGLTGRQLKKATLLKGIEGLEPLQRKLNITRKIKLYQHEGIASPLVFGFIKPRIILPSKGKWDNLDIILLHELVHVKRWDNLWQLLSMLAVCIHWFNPFAWLFLYFYGRDRELACDEKVLRTLGIEHKKAYADALVQLVTGHHLLGSAFGHSSVKLRIVKIIAYKNITLWMAIVATLFCTLMAAMFMTNP